MGRILYLTHDRESALSNGVVDSIRCYDFERKGLSGPWPLMFAQVVDEWDNDEPCCPHYGDEIDLTWDIFERVCSEWHICVPGVGHRRYGAHYDTTTLYLIPDNHEKRWHRYDVVDAVLEMGMSRIYDTVSAQDVITELVDFLAYLPAGEHLHLVILVDHLQLRPTAGQAGSCRCGQIASPACDNRLCASCCSGCSRHPTTSPPIAAPVTLTPQPNSHYFSSGTAETVAHRDVCICGQPAAAACRGLHCATCCQDVLCRRHFAAPDSDSSSDKEELRDHFYGIIPPVQQQQQLRCDCGLPAALTCRASQCGRCCHDRSCRRHFDPPYPDEIAAAVYATITAEAIGPPQQQQQAHLFGVPRAAPASSSAAAPFAVGGFRASAPPQQQQREASVSGIMPAAPSNSAAAATVPFGGFRAGAPAATAAAAPHVVLSGSTAAATPAPSQAAAQAPATGAAGDSANAVVSSSAASGSSLPSGRVYQRYHAPVAHGATDAAGTAAQGAAASSAPVFAGVHDTSAGSSSSSTASVVSLQQRLDRMTLSELSLGTSQSVGLAVAGPAAVVNLRASSGAPGNIVNDTQAVVPPICSVQHGLDSSRQQRYEQLVHQLTELACSGSLQQALLGPVTELLDLVCEVSGATGPAAQAGSGRDPHQASSSAATVSRMKPPGPANACWDTTTSSNSTEDSSAAEQLHQLQNCIVCLDAPRNVMLLPCKHLVLCAACSQQLQQQASRYDPPGAVRRSYAACPVCRQPAKQHMGGIIMA